MLPSNFQSCNPSSHNDPAPSDNTIALDDSVFEIVRSLYEADVSLRSISSLLKISRPKTLKILTTLGIVRETGQEVYTLWQSGISFDDIQAITGKSKTFCNMYIPYSKAIYNREHPTINALRIRQTRKKKKENENEKDHQ